MSAANESIRLNSAQPQLPGACPWDLWKHRGPLRFPGDGWEFPDASFAELMISTVN